MHWTRINAIAGLLLTRYVYGKKYAKRMNDSDSTHIVNAWSLHGRGSMSFFSRNQRLGLSKAK